MATKQSDFIVHLPRHFQKTDGFRWQVLFTTVMDWVTLCFWTSDIAVSFVPLGPTMDDRMTAKSTTIS